MSQAKINIKGKNKNTFTNQKKPKRAKVSSLSRGCRGRRSSSEIGRELVMRSRLLSSAAQVLSSILQVIQRLHRNLSSDLVDLSDSTSGELHQGGSLVQELVHSLDQLDRVDFSLVVLVSVTVQSNGGSLGGLSSELLSS